MTKKNIAADNFIPIMELQAANCVVMLLFFTRNLKLFQRWNLFWPNVLKITWIKELNDFRTPFIGLMLNVTCDLSIEKK